MVAFPPSLVSVLSDRYRLEGELGHGGMATVYLAEDRKHRRKVAIKVLRPELATYLGAERFLREIQIAAKLQHPNILTLIDSGEAASGGGQSSGLLYYVMPYVEGESLRDRLVRERTLAPADVARILLDVLDALAYAHHRGVVHRDIKPENIMLAGRHALVVDFGVAKAVAAAATVDPVAGGTLTTRGLAIGTPAYMAPEQAAGQAAADGRVDLYAVGVTAYEMLSGAPPFTGSLPQAVLAAHLTEAPRPLEDHCPALPAAFAGAIMRCLAKDPAERWQSADELLAQLEPFATPTALAAAGPRTTPLRRPQRWLLVWAALGLLMLGWWFRLGREVRERDRGAGAEPAATPEAPDLAGAALSLPPGRLDRPSADTGASRLYLQGRALLARHREAETREAIRLFETAVARDSTFALGYAGLAVAAAEMHLRFADREDAPAWGERAIRAGRAALRLDQQRAEVHEALAAVHRKTEFDWEATIRESSRALALNPNLANAHFYLGGALFHVGLLDEAERVVLAGLRVQPPGDRVDGTRTLGTVALAAGRYAEAIALLQDVQRLSDRRVADP
ncbi:MAG TPA: protein kinase, partial [Gemmatimonadales bacterium]|nr:protein kinase [Gemmatimonadales bacterium]